eukprot:UN00965
MEVVVTIDASESEVDVEDANVRAVAELADQGFSTHTETVFVTARPTLAPLKPSMTPTTDGNQINLKLAKRFHQVIRSNWKTISKYMPRKSMKIAFLFFQNSNYCIVKKWNAKGRIESITLMLKVWLRLCHIFTFVSQKDRAKGYVLVMT